MAQFSVCFAIKMKLLLFAAKFVLGAAFSTSTLDEDGHDTSKDVLYRLHRPLLLECNVTIEPEDQEKSNWEDLQLRYHWYKDGILIEIKDRFSVPKDSQNLLIITYTTEEDEGEYQCQVKTDHGVASSELMIVRRTFVENLSSARIEIETHFVSIGQIHQLDCSGFSDSYPKATLTWEIQLIDAPIVSNTVLERHITPGDDGILYFAYINQEDADDNIKYVCLAHHPALDKPAILAEYVLQLSANATPQFIDYDQGFYFRYPQHLSNTVTAIEGEPTMLYCIFAGAPLLHPDWYFGNTNVNGGPKDRVTRRNRSAGKRLLIKETHLSDQGTYKCRIAENGKEIVHEIALDVVSAPNITKKSDFVVNAEEGQNVTIICIVKGSPKPTVSWVHNAEPLKIDPKDYPRISVPEPLEASETTVDNSLTISKIRRVDKGYYGCRGSNTVGDTYVEFLLMVM